MLRQCEHLDYRGDLLQLDYAFPDWFDPVSPERIVPAAAFGRTPLSYDSACLAVVVPNGAAGADLVLAHRALGAPFALEVRDRAVAVWTVGATRGDTRKQDEVSADRIADLFASYRERWSASTVLRLKNAAPDAGPLQRDLFVDRGLIPALESQIFHRLDPLLRDTIHAANEAYHHNTSHAPDVQQLFRLIFRVLAAKVMHDRGYRPFTSFSGSSPAQLLDEVAQYYGEPRATVLADQDTQRLVTERLWTGVDFRNLSVEVLTYIYENTLVDEEARRRYGTHSTPHSIARYIVRHLPFERVSESEPIILDPFCGHGMFLVAALQRLRDLLPGNMSPALRHQYFVRSLRGYDIDPFALEVGRLCLMLADFPNKNGWKLEQEDVFASARFLRTVRQAFIVLSNPPFEDFTLEERRRYQPLQSLHKPAEFLLRVLDHLPDAGVLGTVLPWKVLSGSGYRSIRERLAQRFEEIAIVALPDKVFAHSSVESALLIAHTPRTGARPTVTVTATTVNDADRENFLNRYEHTRRDVEAKSPEEVAASLAVPALREAWSLLREPTLENSAVRIHRGIEWQPPMRHDLYTSLVERSGFSRGLLNPEGMQAFVAPRPIFLRTDNRYRRREAYDLPWDKPKVLANAVRASRGPWRVIAVPDIKGLVAYQNFYAIWPAPPWTPLSLAALLNSPVANAFVHAHAGAGRHNQINLIKRIPAPEVTAASIAALDRLVEEYLAAIRDRERSVQADSPDAACRLALLKIDAAILALHDLPPRLERAILDFMSGARPVPFEFGRYFPPEFTATIPLRMYLSPEYAAGTARQLVRAAPDISDEALRDAVDNI